MRYAIIMGHQIYRSVSLGNEHTSYLGTLKAEQRHVQGWSTGRKDRGFWSVIYKRKFLVQLFRT